jgi:hypothetical protein
MWESSGFITCAYAREEDESNRGRAGGRRRIPINQSINPISGGLWKKKNHTHQGSQIETETLTAARLNHPRSRLVKLCCYKQIISLVLSPRIDSTHTTDALTCRNPNPCKSYAF